jgi:hypothetical protein
MIPEGMEAVAISVGIPRWYRGRREIRLAPTRAMLKMSQEEYDRLFRAKLKELDPKELFDAVGNNGVMLCWEKPGESCHRRLVAEWMESNLGIEITELGFERSEVPSYSSLAWSTPKPAKKKIDEQPLLF